LEGLEQFKLMTDTKHGVESVKDAYDKQANETAAPHKAAAKTSIWEAGHASTESALGEAPGGTSQSLRYQKLE
jgi:hypothetical protein